MKKKVPIFILSCQRSGSTLLRKVLDSHSKISCPPESAFLVQFLRMYEIKRSLQGLNDMGFSDRDVLNKMKDFISSFFEEYARKKNKERWAEKTPHYLNHAETIDAVFDQEILYVGIIRHGLDVAYSLCDFDWGILSEYLDQGMDKPMAGISFWKKQNRRLLDFKKKVGDRMHLIKYEDLTLRPEETLKQVFQFIGEDWEKTVMEYNSFSHDEGFGDEKTNEFKSIKGNTGNYKKWDFSLQKKLYQEARECFEQFGYEL